MKSNSTTWHNLPHEQVYGSLKTSLEGLSQTEAEKRLEQYGRNELLTGKKISPLKIFVEQFKNILIIILLIATVLSAFLGHGLEAVVITVIVLFAVLLGFFQEFRAEKALEALQQMAAPVALVIRENKELKIPANQVVPGDIVVLKAGGKVPADIRLIEAINLKADEAALTGESVPVEKQSEILEATEIAVADRKNMAFAGTAITYGRGKGIVVGTGMSTEFGEIAKMLENIETGRTPLQKSLDKLGHTLARGALVLVAVVVGLGLLKGREVVEMFIFGVSLAVAVVPEALPAVVTISLALGVRRMVRRHALVRHLPAVETLGSTTIICTDKTGTLTKDEMTVRKLYLDGKMLDVSGIGYGPDGSFFHNQAAVEVSSTLKQLLLSAALSSDAYITKDGKGGWDLTGDPTEGALVAAAAKAGLHKAEIDGRHPRIKEIPFSSETKRMTTWHGGDSKNSSYSKGAPEVILSSCHKEHTQVGEVDLTDARRKEILAMAEDMAASALRVLAIAYKPNTEFEHAEKEMVFLGLAGMMDPPRAEAKNAIEVCIQAGIKPIMITGDHPVTAKAVASELGLLKSGKVITGAELEAMGQEEFEKEVESISVYARVSPEHKLRVVNALQKKGHVVAMTGDGVNDAPALKKSDIGVAMGITGADVTKEASVMTLTDDNFASIVAAVEEGRGIFGNIKKYLMYLLSSNVGEIGLILGGSILGLPLPLSAVQILYVNLATDGLPALALAVDPPEKDLMLRKPRDPKVGIFTKPVVGLILAGGLWSAVANLTLFMWALSSGRSLQEAMAMTFVSLILIQFFKAYNFRSYERPISKSPFSNKWLNLTIIWELLLLSVIIYLPFLHKPFGTFGFRFNDWLIVIAFAVTVLPVLEIAKRIARQKSAGGL